jgi:hypothetical protein
MYTVSRRWRTVGVPLLALSVAISALSITSPAQAGDERVPPTEAPATLPDDPAVRALATAAYDAVRSSFAVVAAEPDFPFPRGSVESDLSTGIIALPPERRDVVIKTAQALVAESAERRVGNLGQYGRYAPEDFRRLGFSGALANLAVDAEGLRRYVEGEAQTLEREARDAENEHIAIVEAYEKKTRQKLGPFPALTSLALRIENVQCISETSGWGSDELLIGGLRIDELGNTAVVGQFKVSDDFDSGETVTFADPGRAFTSYDLTTKGDWPRNFVNVMIMAEEDNGGFASALLDAWTTVAPMVKEKIATAVATVLAAYVGEAIGKLIGTIVAWLVTAFANWIISLWEDDLINSAAISVDLPMMFELMYEVPTSFGWTNHRKPTKSLMFIGDGAIYKVNVHWQVTA